MTCNTVQNGRFPHPFENKGNMFLVEVGFELAYEICSFVDIEVNQILKYMGTWCSDTGYFWGGSKKTVHCHHPKQPKHLVQ